MPDPFSRRSAAIFLVTILLAGCSGDSAGPNAKNVLLLTAGMTRSEAIAIMGPPKRVEAFGETEFMIYPSGSSEGALVEFVAIAIVEGRVTGTGRALYETVRRAKAQEDADKER